MKVFKGFYKKVLRILVISGRGCFGKIGWVSWLRDRFYGFCGFVTCSDGLWRLSDGFGKF